MVKIDISDDSEYHSQLNNKFFPQSTCNTTSIINGLYSSKIPFDWPKEECEQPEDYLTWLLNSDEAWEKMKREQPWAITQGYEPRNVHAMLEWATNEKLVGRKVDTFKYDYTIEELLFNIIKNKCTSVIGGRFTNYGHIVCLVGVQTNQTDIESVENPTQIKLDMIDKMIIDDPYGDYNTKYRSFKGNGVMFTLEKFTWLIKEYSINKKWAHFLSRV